jgi:hypothetical protein
VREESAKLGLTTVDDPESTKFLSGEAICVTTMQVLINGRSRLGRSYGRFEGRIWHLTSAERREGPTQCSH